MEHKVSRLIMAAYCICHEHFPLGVGRHNHSILGPPLWDSSGKAPPHVRHTSKRCWASCPEHGMWNLLFLSISDMKTQSHIERKGSLSFRFVDRKWASCWIVFKHNRILVEKQCRPHWFWHWCWLDPLSLLQLWMSTPQAFINNGQKRLGNSFS